MKVWARIIGGLLLLVGGVIWTLQGAGATGGSGGMNGRSEWIVIGAVVAGLGLVLLVGGITRLRSRTPR